METSRVDEAAEQLAQVRATFSWGAGPSVDRAGIVHNTASKLPCAALLHHVKATWHCSSMAAITLRSAMQASVSTDAPKVHPYSASYNRTNIKAILGAQDGGVSMAGKSVVVGGWVKSGREQGGGEFAFIQLNDGSIFTDLQVRTWDHLPGQFSWLLA